MKDRIKLFFTFFDSRFEDLRKDNWIATVYRDLSAGMIVAMTAIPMSMGFAMASGLRPEQGIIAGAIACLVGRTFGGSKYQVYGPQVTLVPVIAALLAKYDHSFLVLCSIVAGGILLALAVLGTGRWNKLIPSSIVVGYTVGIGVSIAVTNLDSILGLQLEAKGLFNRLSAAAQNLTNVNYAALFVGLGTFLFTRYLLKVSIFIPAPLLALAGATVLSSTVFAGQGLTLIQDRYGKIAESFFVFTPPSLPPLSAEMVLDLIYFAGAIVIISGVETLLCSSMADRLANNRGTPFNPDKELWGQGLVQVFTPLLNGMPCTGALARTATNIKAGALTPLSGYFKGILNLAMAFYLAQYLNLVPMACIGGVLLWVAVNMVKPAEIRHVLAHSKPHAALMIYTATMVPFTDFMTGVLSALAIYVVFRKRFGEMPIDAAAPARPAQRQPAPAVA